MFNGDILAACIFALTFGLSLANFALECILWFRESRLETTIWYVNTRNVDINKTCNRLEERVSRLELITSTPLPAIGAREKYHLKQTEGHIHKP